MYNSDDKLNGKNPNAKQTNLQGDNKSNEQQSTIGVQTKSDHQNNGTDGIAEEFTERNIKSPEKCPNCNQYDQFINSDYNILICLCKRNSSYFYRSTGLNSDQLRSSSSSSSMLFENPAQIYNYINRCRRWIKVYQPRTGSIFSKKNEFSLTTYNILAQNLLLNHLELYQDMDKSNLEWLERSNRIKQELLELNSDILCLQEVHIENFATSILPFLKEHGYQAVFKQKTGQNHDGCSILFKKNKFNLQDFKEIQFRSNISKSLNRDQVALVVKLSPKDGWAKTNLVVGTTHLIFNPKRGDVKLAQLRLMFAEIQRFSIDRNSAKNQRPGSGNPFKLDYLPIILCGDLNSEPNSPLIKFIENGHLDLNGIKSGDISGQKEGQQMGRFFTRQDLYLDGIDQNCCYINEENPPRKVHAEDEFNLNIKHVFDLKSAYPDVDKFNLRLISMSTSDDCGLVDHLFYSHKHPNLRLAAYKQLMNRRNLKKIGNIPNSILGSDHISLSAKFYLS